MQSAFPPSWNKLESSESLDSGEDRPLVIIVHSGEDALTSFDRDKVSHVLETDSWSLNLGSGGAAWTVHICAALA